MANFKDYEQAYFRAEQAGDKEAADYIQSEMNRLTGMAPQPAGIPSFGRGLLDTAATVGSAAVAEPVAGLLGIAGTVAHGPDVGRQTVMNYKKGMTVDPTPASAMFVGALADQIPAPIKSAVTTGAQKFGELADVAAEAGGPVAGAAVKTAPIAAMEALGFRGASKMIREADRAARIGVKSVTSSVKQAAPTAGKLKEAARGLYKGIRDAGAVVKRGEYRKLFKSIADKADEMAVDKVITPKAHRVFERASEIAGQGGDIDLNDIQQLRQLASNTFEVAPDGTFTKQAAIGSAIGDEIDDFLEALNPNHLVAGSKLPPARIARDLQLARDLWGRAKRSDLISEAMLKARYQKSGFENGIRTQLGYILTNTKKRAKFSKSEIAIMDAIVDGTGKSNFARLIGRLAPSEGAAHNLLTSGLGAAAGFASGGTAGMVAIPTVGYVSRGLAQRMARQSAEFLDDVIRSGRDANKIVRAYMKHTPSARRKANELSELLMQPDIALDQLKGGVGIAEQAAEIASRARSRLEAGVGIAGAAHQSDEALSPTQVPPQTQ